MANVILAVYFTRQHEEEKTARKILEDEYGINPKKIVLTNPNQPTGKQYTLTIPEDDVKVLEEKLKKDPRVARTQRFSNPGIGSIGPCKPPEKK